MLLAGAPAVAPAPHGRAPASLPAPRLPQSARPRGFLRPKPLRYCLVVFRAQRCPCMPLRGLLTFATTTTVAITTPQKLAPADAATAAAAAIIITATATAAPTTDWCFY